MMIGVKSHMPGLRRSARTSYRRTASVPATTLGASIVMPSAETVTVGDFVRMGVAAGFA